MFKASARSRKIFHCLLSSLLVLLAQGSSGQQGPGSLPSVNGRVTDSETGSPLENAIIFLAHTPIGTSSLPNGTYMLILTGVPSGDYDMVISRVGYDRKAVRIRVEKSKSLAFDVQLMPKPIPTPEVEVLGNVPGAAVAHPVVTYRFFPRDTANNYALYGSTTSNPVGIFFTDSAFYMYSLETAVIDGEKFIRLWLLYENLSRSPQVFDPVQCVRLQMHGKRHSYGNVLPAFLSGLPSGVNRDTALAEVQHTIGSFLEELANNQTASLFEESLFDQWARCMECPRIAHIHQAFTPSSSGSLSAMLHSVFTKSVNVGILGRYTVYPENSLNGYLYFPFPGLNWKTSTPRFQDAAEYLYQIVISTPSGPKVIEFVPG